MQQKQAASSNENLEGQLRVAVRPQHGALSGLKGWTFPRRTLGLHTMSAPSRVLVIVALALCTLANAPHVADPFADPKNDPYNILRYIPSVKLAAVAQGAHAARTLSRS